MIVDFDIYYEMFLAHSLNITILLIIAYPIFKFCCFWNRSKIFADLDQTIFNKDHLNITSNYRPDEIYPAYFNTWYPILQSSNLKPGQVKPLYVLEKDLVIFRTESGKVNVLDAYCPHQGAHLGIGGSVLGEDIRCPFHSWAFNGDGDCTSVPGLDHTPKAKIKKWNCIEMNHWIFIWYHDQDADPNWLPPKMTQFENSEFCVETEFYYSSHIMDIYSNGFDVVHFDQLHSMSGIVSDYQVLSRGKFYHMVKKMFHMDTQVVTILMPGEAPIYSRKVTLNAAPVLFGFRLNFLQMNGTITYCPPIGYCQWSSKLFKTKFYIIYAMLPISSMRWHILSRFYHEPFNIVSKVIAKLSASFFLANAMSEIIILNNKRCMKQPYLTKLDKFQFKFCRWIIENFYTTQSSSTNFDQETVIAN